MFKVLLTFALIFVTPPTAGSTDAEFVPARFLPQQQQAGPPARFQQWGGPPARFGVQQQQRFQQQQWGGPPARFLPQQQQRFQQQQQQQRFQPDSFPSSS